MIAAVHGAVPCMLCLRRGLLLVVGAVGGGDAGTFAAGVRRCDPTVSISASGWIGPGPGQC